MSDQYYELWFANIKLKSYKGDYLHRPDSKQGVTAWNVGKGNEWTVEFVGTGTNLVKLKSWKGDYLQRLASGEGVTTGLTGIGIEWALEFISPDKIMLKSCEGDYLYRSESSEYVNTMQQNNIESAGSKWTVELKKEDLMMNFEMEIINEPGDTIIRIVGDKGEENFHFCFSVDVFNQPIFVNQMGIIFGAAETTSDPFFFALVYGRGGYGGPFQGGNGHAWISDNKAMMSLGWPTNVSMGKGVGGCQYFITALDLDINGIATGSILYRWDNDFKTTIIKKWNTI